MEVRVLCKEKAVEIGGVDFDDLGLRKPATLVFYKPISEEDIERLIKNPLQNLDEIEGEFADIVQDSELLRKLLSYQLFIHNERSDDERYNIIVKNDQVFFVEDYVESVIGKNKNSELIKELSTYILSVVARSDLLLFELYLDEEEVSVSFPLKG